MKKLPVVFFAPIIILSIFSCKKHNNPTPVKNITIYFAGSDGDKAAYWENGVEHMLPSALGARVNSIPVSGSNVYFAGFEGPGAEVSYPSSAVYWENGTEHKFSYLNSTLNSSGSNYLSLDLVSNIAFAGADTYISGSTESRAVYWLNGTKHVLPAYGTSIISTEVNDMALSGSDLYLAGDDNNSNAIYWKNGVETILPVADSVKANPAPFVFGIVSRICVSGQDVYCAGRDTWTLAYWKNGIEHNLPVLKPQITPTVTAQISGIAVSGADLYITGSDGNSAVYWKNGVENILPSAGDSYAGGVAFDGTDIYIVGTDSLKPVYWKNGIEVSLPCVNPGNSLGTSIAAVNQ